jgi:aerobic C4-dicarboxylate transport protein
VTLTASLQAFGGEFFSAQSIAVGIALVVGIDRLMSEGRALTNAIGNSVATMVIAGWQGERDDARFQAVLAEPSIVDREVEAALRGHEETERGDDRGDGRFARDGEGSPLVGRRMGG